MLSFTGIGHLNPLIALGQELTHRGHRVTFFERPKIRERIEQAGLGFVPLGAHQSTKTQPPPAAAGFLSELAMLRFNLQRVSGDIERYLRDSTAPLQQAGVDALIVNEIALTGPTLAELLRLPYFIVSTSVPHNSGWNAFPWFSGYRYLASPVSALERAFLEVSALRVRGPIRKALNRARRSAGLGALRTLQNKYLPLAQITQLPRCLDFEEARLPRNCHYTGPFVGRSTRPPVDFCWERLDGRPIAYVSLGTTRNAQARILRMIAEACQDFDVQLVISLGGRFDPGDFGALPGQPLVVSFAPQLEVLQRASVVITHAGPNTIFESLLEGRPIIAIPLALDQPAIAARVARRGAAQVIPVMRLSVARIRAAVGAVLYDPGYREAAVALQQELRRLRGTEHAAHIIEEALHRHTPSQRLPTAV